MSWTDDELRQAIHEAAGEAENDHLYIDLQYCEDPYGLAQSGLSDLRAILTALDIDHQPKPELPTEIGSVIYDVETEIYGKLSVMTLGRNGVWVGIDENGQTVYRTPDQITSFGGVLDLDKVRGEQA